MEVVETACRVFNYNGSSVSTYKGVASLQNQIRSLVSARAATL